MNKYQVEVTFSSFVEDGSGAYSFRRRTRRAHYSIWSFNEERAQLLALHSANADKEPAEAIAAGKVELIKLGRPCSIWP